MMPHSRTWSWQGFVLVLAWRTSLTQALDPFLLEHAHRVARVSDWSPDTYLLRKRCKNFTAIVAVRLRRLLHNSAGFVATNCEYIYLGPASSYKFELTEKSARFRTPVYDLYNLVASLGKVHPYPLFLK